MNVLTEGGESLLSLTVIGGLTPNIEEVYNGKSGLDSLLSTLTDERPGANAAPVAQPAANSAVDGGAGLSPEAPPVKSRAGGPVDARVWA